MNYSLFKDGKEDRPSDGRIKNHSEGKNQWTKRWIESNRERGLIRRNQIPGIDSDISKSNRINDLIKAGNYYSNNFI